MEKVKDLILALTMAFVLVFSGIMGLCGYANFQDLACFWAIMGGAIILIWYITSLME